MVHPNLENHTLLFMHIPKAAGTSLSSIVDHQYGRNRVHVLNGTSHREAIDRFNALPEHERQQIQLWRGHMRFGLHEYVPQPATYFTMLREPVARIISLYNYVRTSPQHHLYEQIHAQNWTLADFMSPAAEIRQVDNGQVRTVSGIPAAFGECTEAMLDVAKANLDNHFAFVGLTERFDETLILMKQLFSWSTPFYRKKNVTRKTTDPARAVISSEEKALVRERNALDIALYTYAQTRFDDLLNQQPAAFHRQLRLFQTLNKLYPHWFRLRQHMQLRTRLKQKILNR